MADTPDESGKRPLPPQETRFQPGRSGNPGGRPGPRAHARKARGLDPQKSAAALAKRLRKKSGSGSSEDAIWDQVVKAAEKGEPWATKLVAERLVAAQSRFQRAEEQQSAKTFEPDPELQQWVDAKLEELQRWAAATAPEHVVLIEAEVQRRLAAALRLHAIVGRDLQPLQIPATSTAQTFDDWGHRTPRTEIGAGRPSKRPTQRTQPKSAAPARPAPASPFAISVERDTDDPDPQRLSR